MKKLRRILVVDGSRVVRVTLSKHLKNDFEILEEGNGESAWQTLMLDASVMAVVSGIHTPKLDAYELLERLHGSSIRRLREIPFVLIVSDIENKAERDADLERGVAAFITKTMSTAEMVDSLNHMLETAVFTESIVFPQAPLEEEPLPTLDLVPHPPLPLTPAPTPQGTSSTPASKPTQTSPSVVALKRSNPPPEALALAPSPTESKQFLEGKRFVSSLSEIKFAQGSGEKICVLVFGIDHYDDLIDSFGEDVVDMLSKRMLTLLLSKVGPLDTVGRCSDKRLAIISHDVDLKQGERFGRQVSKSLAAGQITIRGQKVKLTTSVGIASNSDDVVASGKELLALAEKRLDQALVCGGNTVLGEFKTKCPLNCRKNGIPRLLEVLSAQEDEALVEHIGAIGLKILPLLELMSQELGLGLPLATMKHRLQQRKKTEKAVA